MAAGGLFEGVVGEAGAEVFTTLLAREGVRIERIVSTGQATPVEAPLVGDWDEWVVVLRGGAGLWMEGDGERRLGPGDWVLIPAGRLHRVTWTAAGEVTVWLAVHFGGGGVGP